MLECGNVSKYITKTTKHDSKVLLIRSKHKKKFNAQGSLRLRAGYAIDRFLPFITTGVSFASLGFNYGSEANNNYKATTQNGWVLGGGLEYGVLDNLSVRT